VKAGVQRNCIAGPLNDAGKSEGGHHCVAAARTRDELAAVGLPWATVPKSSCHWPGFRPARAGSGLGLAIIRKLARMMSADVTLANECPGRPTRSDVSDNLPSRKAERAPGAPVRGRKS